MTRTRNGAAKSAPVRASRSQTAASRRAAGLVPVTVWLTIEQRNRLGWIRDEDGHDNAQIIGGHIDAEYEDRMGLAPGPALVEPEDDTEADMLADHLLDQAGET